MAEVVYVLCTLTSALCAALLLRGYRAHGTRLLFWSAICFAGLAISNFVLFLDLFVFPDRSFAVWRSVTSLVPLMALSFGLVWDPKE
jgi:hypothetical protein